MADNRDLPGRPTKALVKEVKAILWNRLRSRPHTLDRPWLQAWSWAHQEAERSLLFQFGKRRRMRWPMAHEIASRYLFLVLLDMRASSQLNLGHRAQESLPEGVRREIAGNLEIVSTLKAPAPFSLNLEPARPALAQEAL